MNNRILFFIILSGLGLIFKSCAVPSDGDAAKPPASMVRNKRALAEAVKNTRAARIFPAPALRDLPFRITEFSTDTCPDHEVLNNKAVSATIIRPLAHAIQQNETTSAPPEKTVAARSPQAKPSQEASVNSENSNFSFYKVKHGLSQGTVRCLLEDRRGNIWYGTYGGGAGRFDGKHFIHYSESEGLSNNVVFSIIEDRSGNLWFATNGGGVCVYNGFTFTTYSKNSGLGSNSAYCLFEDHDGNIWIGTENAGLVKYDGKKFTKYTTAGGLAGNTVFCITEDSRKRIWTGTESGVSCIDNDSITNYGIKEGFSSSTVLSIHEKPDGTLLFGTLLGVNILNGGKFSRLGAGELSKTVVYSIHTDKRGDTWFGTINGLARLRNNTICIFREEQGLSSNIIYCMLEEKSGNLWLGSGGGGLIHTNFNNFRHFKKSDGLPSNLVFGISQDHNRNIWFGTLDGGISCLSGKKFRNFSFPGSHLSNFLYCVYPDQKGNLWFGTDGAGVLVYNGKNFKQLQLSDTYAQNSVYCITGDSAGNLWFGTNGGGAVKYNGQTLSIYSQQQGLSNDVVYAITRGAGSELWFATYNGLNRFDGKDFFHYHKKDGLADDLVLNAVKDRRNNLWIGTNNGLSILTGGVFYSLTEKEGLCNNSILSIAADQNGDIWAGTRNGLSRISAANNSPVSEKKIRPDYRIYNYSYDDGFRGLNCRRNSSFSDQQGNLWWGADVLTMLPAGQLQPDTSAAVLELQAIKLMDTETDWVSTIVKRDEDHLKYVLRDTMLDNGFLIAGVRFNGTARWNPVPLNLSLPHTVSNIAFNFVGIHIADRNHVRYTWKLEGSDQGWSIPGSKTEASFNNLAPGSYSFMVKCANRSGIWSNTLVYPFEVRPAWWQTWWFKALVLLAITGLIRLYIYQRELHNRRTEEKLEKQNQELRKINSELDRFVYSASHELRAPLASLLGLLNLTRLEANTASLSKKLDMMTTAVKRLDLFITDILNYSRNSRTEPEISKINFEDLINESFRTLAYLEQKDKVELKTNIQGCDFYSDRQRIIVLFNNFLSNAIKYQRPGEPHPYVKIEVFCDDRKAMIEISDNGYGILPEHQEKIFNMFYRANEVQPGSGLGLYISQEIIQKMGGTLSVNSKVNSGTTFTFTLPNHQPGI